MLINLENYNRGKFYLKLNNTLLTEPTFVNKLNLKINKTTKEYTTPESTNSCLSENNPKFSIKEEELLDLILFNATL